MLHVSLPPSFPFCLEGPHPSNACLQRPPVLFFPIKSWNMRTLYPLPKEKRGRVCSRGKCFHFALGDRAKDQITPPVKEERFPTSYANTISFFRDLFIFVLGFSLGWIVNRRRRRDEEEGGGGVKISRRGEIGKQDATYSVCAYSTLCEKLVFPLPLSVEPYGGIGAWPRATAWEDAPPLSHIPCSFFFPRLCANWTGKILPDVVFPWLLPLVSE